jgi:carbon storage regulator CsrA
MLVLTRKSNESIVIGDNVRVTVVEIGPGRVRIGIEAPKSVRVDRAEIHEKKLMESNPQAAQAPLVVNRIAEVLPPQPDTPSVISPQPGAVTNRIQNLRTRLPKKPR